MSIRIDISALVDKKFIGIPYQLFGKTIEACDCVGLSIMWLAEQGLFYEYDDYRGAMRPDWFVSNPKRLLDAVLTLGEIVPFSMLKKYDCIILYGSEQAMFPSCLAVMVDDRHFLMTTEDRGSFVAVLDMHWKTKFWGAIRLKKAVAKWG